VTTYGLIPGAGGSAWYWHRVVPLLLLAAGHTAIAVDLPGDAATAGPPEYARSVTGAIAEADADGVVLVAQSLGGFTAPLVTGALDVRALVFVNAMIPVPGETPGDWWQNTGAVAARTAAAEAGGYGTELDPAVYFLHDVPPEVLAAGPSQERPEADAVFVSTCDFDGWPTDIPIRVVAGSADRLFPVGFQQRVAQGRLGVDADVLPGGHLLALSEPAALADYLLGV
jgi:pimeloyl-ACP methyl ester carboxylesterase